MSILKLKIPAPSFDSLEKKNIPERLLMGPGPANFTPNCKRSLTTPLISPFEDEMFELIDDIKDGIRYVFQTDNRLTFAFSGAAMAAMECAISNLIEPGEVFLVMNRGIWDSRAAEIGRIHGAVVREVIAPPGTVFTLEQIEDALKAHQPTVLFITQGDSSTGTIQQIQGVGDLCRRYNALSIVDVVVSVGAVPYFMDDWNIDVTYAGGQKALSAPPCISPISFGPRAEKKALSQVRSKVWYYDLKQIANQWNCFGDTRGYHHTASSVLMFALRESLADIAREGLPNVWERHEVAAKYLYGRLKELDVEYLVKNPADRLVTVTPLILPKEYNYPDVVRYLRNTCGVVTNPGLGSTAGKCLRIGCMGHNARPEAVDKIIEAMKKTLSHLRGNS